MFFLPPTPNNRAVNLLDAFRHDPMLVEHSFAARSTAGRVYFDAGQVRAVQHAELSASAAVHGSAEQPYFTQISLVDRKGGRWLVGACTCAYAEGCKHAAALGYAVADHVRKLDGKTGLPSLRRESHERATEHDPWAIWQRQIAQMLPDAKLPLEPELRPLRFVLRTEGFEMQLQVLRGRYGKQGRISGLKSIRIEPKRVIERSELDEPLGRTLLLALSNATGVVDEENAPWYPLSARSERAFLAVLAAQQVHWEHVDGPVLSLRAARTLQIVWQTSADGKQWLQPKVEASERTWVVGHAWNWFIEPASAGIGPVEPGALKPYIAALQSSPPALPERVDAVRERLKKLPIALNLPSPQTLEVQQQQIAPAVLLRLSLLPNERDPSQHLDAVLLEPWVRYSKSTLLLNDRQSELREFDGKRVLRYLRDKGYENALRSFLQRQGFIPGMYWEEDAHIARVWKRAKRLANPEAIARWSKTFIADAALAGYQIETAPGFPLEIRPVLQDIELQIDDPQAGSEWFETRLGVEIDGLQVDLAPLLIAAMSDPGAWQGEFLALRLADGREVLVAGARVQPLLAILSEMEQKPDGALAVSRTRLHALEVPPDVRLQAGEAAAKLRTDLANFAGLREIALPASFLATLRPYQQQGVSWLQFLRELRFGGVLADDMGLGKTVQVLAHLCVEHAAGRLAEPALVVCPTSVVGNWEAEVARFAPELQVVVFHGSDRSAKTAQLAAAHLVITSYALLARDAQIMAKQRFSWAIFDEAQWLKNSGSKSFAAAVQINAGQRLCMTGTPVENHLGELKSQFDLAFPGLLGSQQDFLQRFRTPIEKDRDPRAAAQLKRRIAPFLLRRKKSEVATELPPRSTLIQRIELQGPQRDLYESIRMQMEKRVRDALEERGLAGSSITILDALLKLRQVCCHPHLLKETSAKKVVGAAKLEALCELLPTLIEEGRSVLLFSQFTSMLDLIEPELDSRKIDFVRLDGSTRDRSTPVKRFQAGEVPLFLISLKAGGVGLNLTRADTVILYDPWWNPAVEQQAIDRAHRIGQDKPVFVYELSCINTVEDKMQKLKERKRAIADAVLDEGEAALGRLSGAELLELFG